MDIYDILGLISAFILICAFAYGAYKFHQLDKQSGIKELLKELDANNKL